MKRLFLLSTLFISVLFLIGFSLKPYRIKEYNDSIDVLIIYKDQETPLKLDPYTTIESALNLIELKDDIDYTKLNMNKILAHKDVLNIPIKTETACISINTSTLEELTQLKGVGEKTALTIIDYRETIGLFQTLEDIMNVKGIGPAKFEKMVESMCL